MEPVELAPTLRPLLAAGERIVCVQNRVGLYHGAARDSEHDNGTVYLTTQRIVYVDQQSPRQRSAALGLARVRRRSLHSGFLYASAKISLHLWPLTAAGGEDAPGGAIGGPGTLQSAPGADRPEAGWRCTICEQVNRDGAKCTLCGVPRQADAPDLGLGPSPAMPGADTPDATRCPTCTFDNHTSMARCEMCDSELRPATPTSVDTSSATDAASGTGTEAATAEAADEVIKLSFRGGGSSQFYTALKDALSDPAAAAAGSAQGTVQSSVPESAGRVAGVRATAGGISTIVRTAHATERERDMTLQSGFADLEALTAAANEMVGLAEHIATQLHSPAAAKLRRAAGGSGSGGESDEARMDAFRQYLLDLGIDSPVTKDSAGAVFHEELARELCDYLENYVSQRGGTVALVDAYCLYNRAREFSLVYPSDFVQACRRFDDLGLGLRLREYPSGLLAIEDPATASDELIAARIGSYVQSFGPVTANDIAAMEDCPLTLAEERLWLCERAGRICRDESVEGVRFYANLFLDASCCSNRPV